MGKKVNPIIEDGKIVGYMSQCPGCGFEHFQYVAPSKDPLNKGMWNFSGTLENPTIRPSYLSKVEPSAASGKPRRVCHSFMVDGHFQFLSDCTHELAGQTVEIPDWQD